MTVDTHALMGRVVRSRRALDTEMGRREALITQWDSVVADIDELQADIMELERSALLLTSIGEERQMKAQDDIEALVTAGLQVIFDETLSFHIVQNVKGKSAVADFVIRSSLPGGKVVDTPVLEARGGGVAAVVGFLLRLVVLLLRKDPHQERFLLLDETFAHVSDEYLPGLGEFLKQVVERSGVQVLMVTHQPEFAELADKVYRFSTDAQGRTVVKGEK